MTAIDLMLVIPAAAAAWLLLAVLLLVWEALAVRVIEWAWGMLARLGARVRG
jgi:hypothetical protein